MPYLSFKMKDTQALLRWSLGLVYLWFGALKLLGMSPIVEIIQGAYPALATKPLYALLSLFETGAGAALLIGGAVASWAAAAVALHILGTFGVFLFSPKIAFLPGFPFLTLEGEFVAKNLVLLAAALMLFWRAREKDRPQDGRLMSRAVLALAAVAVLMLSVAGQIVHNRELREAATSIRSDRPHLSVGELASFINSKKVLVIEGTVSDRCQLMGCWLKLRDASGELFIDLASSTVNARALPVGSEVRVSGRIGKTRLGDIGFVADGLESLNVPKKGTP